MSDEFLAVMLLVQSVALGVVVLQLRLLTSVFRELVEQIDKWDEGRRAAIRGESLSQYAPSYRRQPALWARFQLGYLDQVRDQRRAQLREPKHVR